MSILAQIITAKKITARVITATIITAVNEVCPLSDLFAGGVLQSNGTLQGSTVLGQP